MYVIAKALERHRTLEELDVSHNTFCGSAALMVAEMVRQANTGVNPRAMH